MFPNKKLEGNQLVAWAANEPCDRRWALAACDRATVDGLQRRLRSNDCRGAVAMLVLTRLSLIASIAALPVGSRTSAGFSLKGLA